MPAHSEFVTLKHDLKLFDLEDRIRKSDFSEIRFNRLISQIKNNPKMYGIQFSENASAFARTIKPNLVQFVRYMGSDIGLFFSGFGKNIEYFASELTKQDTELFAISLGANAEKFADALGSNIKYFINGLNDEPLRENRGYRLMLFGRGLKYNAYSFAKGIDKNITYFCKSTDIEGILNFMIGLGKYNYDFARGLKNGNNIDSFYNGLGLFRKLLLFNELKQNHRNIYNAFIRGSV